MNDNNDVSRVARENHELQFEKKNRLWDSRPHAQTHDLTESVSVNLDSWKDADGKRFLAGSSVKTTVTPTNHSLAKPFVSYYSYIFYL